MRDTYFSKMGFMALFLSLFTFTMQAQIAKVSVDMPTGIDDIQALEAAFGPGLGGDLSGTLVTADAITACDPLVNDLTGSIALVDRGACGFTTKVYNAQLAGAIAVVLCNNNTTRPYESFILGSAAGDPLVDQITIPSVMISFAECEIIKANMPGVMVTLSDTPIPPGPGDVCDTAIEIGPGTHTVDSITAGYGAVFSGSTNAKWFSYTPTANTLATVSSCNLTDVDTRVVVLGGSDCQVANLVVIGSNDDCDPDNANFASEFSWAAQAGVRYWIYWDDPWDYNGFDFELTESALPSVNVTFTVDMSQQTVGGDGVNMVWATPDVTDVGDVNVLALSDNGDGTWSGTLQLETLNDTIGYAFVNGAIAVENVEAVPDDCGLVNSFGFNIRPLVVASTSDVTLPSVCFSGCGACVFTVEDCGEPFVWIEDNIDEYTEGDATGQADHWGRWPGAESSGVVTTEQALSGTQSIKVSGDITGQDVLLNLEDRSEGHFMLRWDMYIPADGNAYFNVQHQAPTATAGYWALDVYMDNDGEGLLDPNDGSDGYAFEYPEDEWFQVIFLIDLDNDIARMVVIDKTVATWTFSNGVTNGGDPFPLNQLNSVNFYPIDDTYTYYIDDVLFQQIPAAGAGQYCYTAEEVGLGTHTTPELDCFGGYLDIGFFSAGTRGEKAYWYKYTAESDGILSISSCGGAADTRGWILHGDDCLGAPDIWGVNDDMCDQSNGDPYASYREAIVTAGETYYVVWDNIWDPTSFDWELALSTDAPAEGEWCQTAIEITPGEYFVEEITGNGAVGGPVINASGGTTPYSQSIWYAFTPEIDGLATVTSCEGAASDTRVFVYTGDCGGSIYSLDQVGFNDDFDCGIDGLQSRIDSIEVVAGTTYYIEWLDAWDDDPFAWELIFEPSAVKVTFQVDMNASDITIDPTGVFVSGNFNTFGNTVMNDSDGDGIYVAEVLLDANKDYTYRFKNGITGSEMVPAECATGGFRTFTTELSNLELPLVCFGFCEGDCTVSVDETLLGRGFTMFPNPAKDQVQLRFDFDELITDLNVQVINSLGQTVIQRFLGDIRTDAVELNLSSLPAGLYLVHLSNGTHQTARSLVVD